MGSIALPAGELALRANVAPQTASAHLSKLLEGKLLDAEVQGRHRYYRLASPEVATLMESLAALTPRAQVQPESGRSNPLCFARTCYNHLAGTLAVQINEALVERRILVPGPHREYRVTNEGRAWFEELGIDMAEIGSGRRSFARPCLDWTERRHHLAGALGTALLQRFIAKKWIVRVDKTRAVRITHNGQEEIGKLLRIQFKR